MLYRDEKVECEDIYRGEMEKEVRGGEWRKERDENDSEEGIDNSRQTTIDDFWKWSIVVKLFIGYWIGLAINKWHQRYDDTNPIKEFILLEY